MQKKARLVSIGAAIVVGVSVLVVNPFAQAQTTDDVATIMRKCANSQTINGKAQEPKGIGYPFEADRCDFVEESFTTSEGPETKASVDFANCPPDVFDNGEAEVTYSHTVDQVVGTAKIDEAEQEALAGPINAAWTTHNNVTDLKTRSVTITNTDKFAVTEGQVLTVYFTPKINTMKGSWKVHTDARTGPISSAPAYDASAPETVTGPAVLPSGSIDGTATPRYAPC